MKRILVVTFVVFTMAGFGVANANGVKGKVNFQGTPPPTKKISMNADANCLKLNPTGVSTDYVMANPNGTLGNVFVYIKDGLKQASYPAPKEPVVLDQKGCFYHPHVMGLMVGQSLEIRNSDATLHNVHAMPKDNKQFNIGMPVKDMKMTRTFDKAEIGVRVKCDVHPWMKAWANVVPHPFFAVTGSDGSFDLKDVPAGTYTVATWHEMYGTKEASVTVTADKVATVEFTYSADKDKATAANAQ